jgi:cytochrome c oxidase cbb3-type subunit 4
MIQGIITLVFMVCFLGVAVWAYSRRNRARFDDAAQLPLTDEAEQRPAAARHKATQPAAADTLPPCCRGEAQ